MEIRRADEFGGGIRERISEIFVDAFGRDLRFFSKDPGRLIRAFSHVFVLDCFYAAVIDGKIAGITACVDEKHFCIKHDKKILKKHLGLIKGSFAAMVFKNYFNKYPKYPAETGMDEKTASVEFVATASEYKRMGVATAIMNHIFTLPGYSKYILEAADTNTGALQLYRKLGYKEVCRKKQGFSKFSGINYLVYMKYTKDET
ncbi:MAG: GNAT family N-acetyltransferase [Treponema sp.]|jgi:ribosomal protein S18 acetylase RimI-like enzyme|nr:GNAT family N-acetyltransferase [Treponema sp.]